MISIIALVLNLLGTALASAKIAGLPAELIAGLENAIAELTKVQGMPVSFQQLENLRVKTEW